MGERMPRLLDVFGIPHRSLGPSGIEGDVEWAAVRLRETRRPVALIVPPGLFE
jgi:hypothetical protein